MDTTPNNRILIVDDNCAIHADFRRILGASPTADLDWAASEIFGDTASHTISYELSFCTQGKEAVEAVSSSVASDKTFAIAFVDMRMPPGIDGVETIARMWQADPELQAVICTAYSDQSWEQIIARLGRTDQFLVLKKPFEIIEACQIASSLARKWNLKRQTELQMQEMARLVESRAGELMILNSEAFKTNDRLSKWQQSRVALAPTAA